jgi:hypothetical protein
VYELTGPLFVFITVLLDFLNAAVCYMQSVQKRALKLLDVEARTIYCGMRELVLMIHPKRRDHIPCEART